MFTEENNNIPKDDITHDLIMDRTGIDEKSAMYTERDNEEVIIQEVIKKEPEFAPPAPVAREVTPEEVAPIEVAPEEPPQVLVEASTINEIAEDFLHNMYENNIRADIDQIEAC